MTEITEFQYYQVLDENTQLKSRIEELEAENKYYRHKLTNLAKSPQGFTGYWKDYAAAAIDDTDWNIAVRNQARKSK